MLTFRDNNQRLMKPKFKTVKAWEQAQMLMQPALIRILDNIRKQLDNSAWKGEYKEVVDPIPGYHLCLTSQGKLIEIDIWELCYQVCFQNYLSLPHNIFSSYDQSSHEVEIDTRLIDDTGEVDWKFLEAKAQKSVRQVIENLPER
jgi:hypothetical protein